MNHLKNPAAWIQPELLILLVELYHKMDTSHIAYHLMDTQKISQNIAQIATNIWVNYNDLTDLPHWKSWFL